MCSTLRMVYAQARLQMFGTLSCLVWCQCIRLDMCRCLSIAGHGTISLAPQLELFPGLGSRRRLHPERLAALVAPDATCFVLARLRA